MMKHRDKILGMLEKKNTLTFEEIADELRLDHDNFEKLITSMQNDKLVIINETEETVSLKKSHSLQETLSFCCCRARRCG